MHSDWFNGIEILQGRWQHGEKVGYSYHSGLEKTLCKWGIYVPLVTKGLHPTALHVRFVVDKLVPQHFFSCQTSFQQCSTSIHLLSGSGTIYNIEGPTLAPPIKRVTASQENSKYETYATL
jgi:hypothetical protein